MADYSNVLKRSRANVDPWAWRSDMDAPQMQAGPVPEVRAYEPAWHDRIVNVLTNAVYGENANAQQRDRVNILAGPDNPFNIPAQVNQGYNTLAHGVALRDPAQAGIGVAQMAMSLPFGVVMPRAVRGLNNVHFGPKNAILTKENVAGFDPPNLPQRPFENDYRRGIEGPPGSQLTHDIEGRPITAEYVAGRRTIGGGDEGIGLEDMARLSQKIASSIKAVPRGELPRKAVGSYTPRTNAIRVADDLSPADSMMVLSHETGHAIDRFSDAPSLVGKNQTQARDVYSYLSTGKDDGPKFGPEKFGYGKLDVAPELLAESIRAYMQNPNYIKTVAPDLAREIRRAVNDSPALKRIIQFNSAAGLMAGGAAATAGTQAEARPTQDQ